jgi:hypothetical protein
MLPVFNKSLSSKEIFDCLTSDVRTPAQLKQKLISKYPSKKDFITSTFGNYGL